MRMRLMLLGGGSALGQALIRLGASEDIVFMTPKAAAQGWDVEGIDGLFTAVQPDVVINLAYYRDWFQEDHVEKAQLARQLKVVERLATHCGHRKIILLQPSSYSVFDGARATAYTEKDQPHPLSPIGETLLRIEERVRHNCIRHVILRLGWLIDEMPEGRVDRFLEWAQRAGEICLADDRRGNPTPVDDAARVIFAILKQLDCQAPLWGTFHYGGMEAMTALGLGQAILNEARQYRPVLDIEPVAKAHTALEDARNEPLQGVMDCRKIFLTFGIKPRPWRACLPVVLDRYYRNKDAHQN